MADVRNIRTSLLLLIRLLAVILVVGLPRSTTLAALSTSLTSNHYDKSCKNLQSIALAAFKSQLKSDGRVGASICRLHFHDCFVNGCDGSNLLDDNATFTGEKNAGPNANSLRGFSAVDAIKSAVEKVCPRTVSCADILALATRDAVFAAGGPTWTVEFGRLDGVTASLNGANSNLPSPNSNVQALTSSFSRQGLSQLDMVALAAAHTFGKTKCGTISARLYNWQNSGAPDPSLNTTYLSALRRQCPKTGSTSTPVNLDQSTATTFDKNYFTNLLFKNGTLFSDQSLFSEGGTTAKNVRNFAGSQSQFFAQFANSIIKMGRIAPPSGSKGQIRLNCRKTESAHASASQRERLSCVSYIDVSPHRRSSESAALGLEIAKLSRVNSEEELLVKLLRYRVNERLLFLLDSSDSSLETPGITCISSAPSRFSADGQGIETGKLDRTSTDSERCVGNLPNQGVCSTGIAPPLEFRGRPSLSLTSLDGSCFRNFITVRIVSEITRCGVC